MNAGGGAAETILALSTINTLDWQVAPPPSLTASISLSPGTEVATGSEFIVSLTARNDGDAAVLQVTPSLTFEGDGQVSEISGPDPAEEARLEPGQEAQFAYRFEADAPGEVTFDGQVQGVDESSGGTVTSAVASVTLTIGESPRIFVKGDRTAPLICAAGPCPPLEPVWVGDNISYHGENWDPDGGPIQVFLDGEVIGEYAASDTFEGNHRMQLFPEFVLSLDTPPACRRTLQVQQDNVELTVDLQGEVAEEIVFAENAKVSAFRGDGGAAGAQRHHRLRGRDCVARPQRGLQRPGDQGSAGAPVLDNR